METGGGRGGANMGAGNECMPDKGGVGRGTLVAGEAAAAAATTCAIVDGGGCGCGTVVLCDTGTPPVEDGHADTLTAGFEKARLEETVATAGDAVLKGVTLPRDKLLTLLL